MFSITRHCRTFILYHSPRIFMKSSRLSTPSSSRNSSGVIKAARGLVKQQVVRVRHHGPGDGYALALSAGEILASGGDTGVEALGALADEAEAG